ncbi:MAG TPA: TIM-barrel domain-containing protein, partial [Duganella sp.]|nr:TIM-barrel domain-containing protein [Duganella sp.]
MKSCLSALPLAFALLAPAAHAAVEQIHARPDGIEATVNGKRLRVLFVTDRIVRVTATPNPQWSTRASMMRVPLMNEPGNKPGRITLNKDSSTLTLRSSALVVSLRRASGALTVRDRADRVLLREHPTAPRGFTRTDVIKSLPDPDTVRTVQTVDGERQQIGAYRRMKDREAWSATARFRLADGEALYGLGFDETSDLNLRGKLKRLYQHNLRVPVPFVVSTRGYGLLFDSYSAMTFADSQEGTSVSSDVVDELDYYFVLGPTIDGAIAGYRQLTGAASMLPRWAYGYIQSRERYATQQELVDTVRQFRERKIPLDMIVQDWQYWSPGRWGSVIPDPLRYPDIRGMTSSVHDMNAKVMISIWPNPSQLDAPGREMKTRGMLSSGSAYVDFFRREAADFYFDQVWQHLGRHGIDAWWTDSTEPEVADWTNDAKRPADADRMNIDGLAKVIDPQWLNAYALANSRALARFVGQAAPDKRIVNLTRSGYAGSQATGAVVWTGDISANWRTLAQQVAAVQGMSASGLPNVSFDVGGFFVKPGAAWYRAGDYPDGAADLGYRELYTRWMQLGAFVPVFRSHGTDTPREPWYFGEPGTPFHDAILASIRLRYRLLPYLYSEAGHAYHDGSSLIRPVAFGYPQDRRTHDLKGQMLFGRDILVSPVLSPMYYGAGSTPLDGASRKLDVYLPPGTWFDFWTGEAHAGGRSITVDAPIERMPVHVRAGSVLPLGPVKQYADEAVDAPIEVRVYPGADGSYTLYDDAGEGWAYQRGEHASIPLRWHQATRTLTIGARKGRYAGMQNKLTFKLVVVGPRSGRGLEEGAASSATVEYTGRPVRVRAADPASA